MTTLRAALWASAAFSLFAAEPGPVATRPKAGPVAIMKAADIKAGMKAVAWTVFEGTTPEAIPIEIIGHYKNAWGPRQDIIIGKMGGRAAKTNVAGGMSGSPVYVDGKLIGAVALRLSVFSPDAICGITPMEYMLEINELDASRPQDARAPLPNRAQLELPLPDDLLGQVVAAGARGFGGGSAVLVPIETPISFAGFHENTLREFRPFLEQMGMVAVQGGAAGSLSGAKPAPGWQTSLQPGDSIAGVLVDGDMSVTGLGTVSYNDGKRVLGFGHSFFNFGPISMPMAKGEVLMTLGSAFQPNKMANATDIVGALRQDRHSGIMGVLGETAGTIPVALNVRSLGPDQKILQEKKYNFDVFVNQKLTPLLMMLTVFNTLQGMNEFGEETTYRLSGMLEFSGGRKLNLNTIMSTSDMPIPPALQLAGWWSEKFSKLFLNMVENPQLKRVDATIDLLPERRSAVIESAWLNDSEVVSGGVLRGRFTLHPYRGERIARDFEIKVPSSLPRGEHRLLISDADTLNRIQTMAGMMSRYMDVEQTISLLQQERTNDKVYLSLVEQRPTVYADDKALSNLPASIVNALQASRASGKSVVAAPETATEQKAIPFPQVIAGNMSLRFTVK